jgi:hypothetical protein
MSSGMSPTNFTPQRWPDAATKQFVCPYCGSINDAGEGQCPQCTMENTAAGRKATKARIGPWYVLQKRNPAAPGMKFETLLSFVNKGRVKAHSIIRGPTTHQLWKFAAHVRGLSREFGLCYSCGSEIERDAAVCPKCNRPQILAQPDIFLESADGEATPAVYRVLPASAGATTDTPTSPTAVADPSFSSANVGEPPTGADSAAQPIEPATPPPNSSHDMIIPSLSEEAPPTTARPASPRERLANLNRTLAVESKAPELEDIGDSAFDDGPTRPPGQIGPSFVASGRPPGPAPRRRKLPEAAMFVLVLLAAVGSGWLYVDKTVRTRAQSWADNMLASVGVTSSAKQPVALPAGTDPGQLSSPPQSSRPPLSVSAPTVHPGPTSTSTDRHPSPAPAVVQRSDAGGSAPPGHTSPPTQPLAADTSEHAVTPPPVPVTPAPAPAPAADSSATNDNAAGSPGDDDPFTKARNLRRRAIDAENSGDYPAAVTLFEQIKDLPRESWPGDLELRLRAAKANAEGQPRSTK